jgi:dTDP-4-amino-4,6-dideoxygalactose transaminase
MYYLLLPEQKAKNALLSYLQQQGIGAVFHYIPLHSSPAGMKYGRTDCRLPVTDAVSERLIRLPLWMGMPENVQMQVIKQVILLME